MRATKTGVTKQVISVALLPLLPLIAGCTSAEQRAYKGEGITEQISQNASEVKNDVSTWGLRAATWINSTARLNDLTNKTAQAISEGLLSKSQAISLHSSVQFIEQEQKRLDSLSGEALERQRQKLFRDIARTSDRLDRWVNLARVNVQRRLDILEERIAVEAEQSKLTRKQRDDLRHSLRWIRKSLAESRESHGFLEEEERERLLADIDRVNNRVDGWVAGSSTRWF